MAAILRIKVGGNWIDVPAVKGTSAYESAVAAGYTGTEEEFQDLLYLTLTNEETRVSAEGNRVSAESSRSSAETSRSEAEITRQNQEGIRVSNETSRSAFYAGFNSQLADNANQQLQSSHVLRSLPNGVADSFGTSGKIQRVSNEYAIKSTDIYSVVDRGTSLTQCTTIPLNQFLIGVVYPPIEAVEGKIAIVGWTEISFVTVPKPYVANKFATGNTRIYFDFPYGTTIEQAKTALVGTIVTFQLTTPVTVALPTVQSPNTKHLVNTEIDRALQDSIKYTTQAITLNGDGTVQRVDHKIGSEIIRIDAFTYATNTITETRTLVAGGSLTFIHHLDTLEMEVI